MVLYPYYIAIGPAPHRVSRALRAQNSGSPERIPFRGTLSGLFRGSGSEGPGRPCGGAGPIATIAGNPKPYRCFFLCRCQVSSASGFFMRTEASKG